MAKRKRRRRTVVHDPESFDWRSATWGKDGTTTLIIRTALRDVVVQMNEHRLVELITRLRGIAGIYERRHASKVRMLHGANDAIDAS